MKKIWTFLLMIFSSTLAFATDSSLSFNPPPTDYSVIFLGNIFGIVDGVLHGTGSQIMGEMFGVFNAAVLALGGVVVMYTLVVGTMNTAQEGQMLGQKWSSIWIPVRATTGLAFLIPKASGYCLMQIFIMWVCVQGVGAADKVWDAALSYLNRGGSILKAQQSMNATDNSSKDALVAINKGAQVILSGEVCMRGLQKVLETKRNSLLEKAKSESGDCASVNLEKKDPNDPMVYFCKNPVPDFIGSVNVINDYKFYLGSHSPKILYVNMPNFQDEPYSDMNGYCGRILWNEFNPNLSGINLSDSETETVKQSRMVAIQQMYADFTPVAIEMIDNDPQLTSGNNSGTTFYSDIAVNQFGVPLLDTGDTCSGPSKKCVNWGPDTSAKNQTLTFTGFEFQNAILDYNGIMMPSVNLINNQKSGSSADKLKSFIKQSEDEGWIMAGAYFFNLVYLNGLVTTGSNQLDKSNGLDGSTFSVEDFLSKPFANPCPSNLCKFLQGDTSGVTSIANLMDGRLWGNSITPVTDTSASAKTNKYSSTTFGFITNGALVHLPGQPGLETPEFYMNFNIQAGETLFSFPRKKFKCRIPIICIDKIILDGLYNDLFRGIVNVFMSFIVSTFNLMLQTFLYVPLNVLMMVFNNGVQLLQTTMIHPIVALAYMGSAFINASVDIWLNLIAFCGVFAPFIAILIPALLLVLPFLASWLGVMASIGWIDAYYAPFIPYMIFTFGTIAWLMAVIEAMVAGPIVALGVSHPEGHDALGKAEQAIMILINVFLRPAMMIIGYIASISLSYVTIFILNSGFVHIMQFLLPHTGDSGFAGGVNYSGFRDLSSDPHSLDPASWGDSSGQAGAGQASPYYNWSAIYASFFCLVTYTSLYLTVVQKSFTLIHTLPDKILRWIGSQGESYGQETSQWAEDTRGQVKEAGQETGKAGMKTGGKPMELAESAVSGAAKSKGGDVGKS